MSAKKRESAFPFGNELRACVKTRGSVRLSFASRSTRGVDARPPRGPSRESSS
jgi:hypothetical protein